MEEITPYGSESAKKSQVAKMFDNIAPYYDFLNHFLSLGIDRSWRKKAIGTLLNSDPKFIIDVATGTGDLAIEAARRLKPDKVIGVDIANEMLAVGRKKIIKKELQRIVTMENGDSENLRFEDNTFDAATVAFGVRNFENLERGLMEMNRVLKPTGKLVILEFSKPTIFPFKQLYHFYFRNILPLIGKITSKDPEAYGYLYRSVQAFPEGSAMLNILGKTGFNTLKCKRLTLGICSLYTASK